MSQNSLLHRIPAPIEDVDLFGDPIVPTPRRELPPDIDTLFPEEP